MDLNKFSDSELLHRLEQEFAIERNASRNILLYLKEIHSRRLYAKRGFPNLFWMLIKHFRQSETSANQRVKALELMLAVPAVEERLISGDLNLSTVAMAQRQIKREEKLTGAEISQEKKRQIVQSITGKTIAQTEIELFKQLPATASEPKTFERRISETMTRMNLNIPDDVRDMMVRLKEIWAHADPTMENIEVMRRAFKIALEQVDPAQRRNREAGPSAQQCATDTANHCATETVKQRSSEMAKHRSTKRLTYYGKEFDRALWERAGSQCEFVDPITERRCDCKFGLQRDHIVALAKGGTNELANMQLLCSTHNQLRARMEFGDAKIDKYQRRNETKTKMH